MDFENSTVLEVKVSDKDKNLFALFCDNQVLYLFRRAENKLTKAGFFKNIEMFSKVVNIHFYHPYICISEKYGLNASVINVENGKIQEFKREDYHADVSAYSIGFIEKNGKILLIHQSQWNRLDITDLETGALLTERKIKIDVSPDKYDEKTGKIIKGKRSSENYLDYFHSTLHIAPDGKNFLSNGWVWSPVDNIRGFNVEEFFSKYELCSFGIEYAHGYNWDRPCTFIDNDTFAVIADDHTKELDEDELKEYEYRQLLFYRFSDINSGEMWLESFKSYKTDVFECDPVYGEVKGEIYFDKKLNKLVALNEKGMYLVTLEGEVTKKIPDIEYKPGFLKDEKIFINAGVWKYSPEHHFFYRFSEDRNIIEIKEL
jgi:hypothetical protein